MISDAWLSMKLPDGRVLCQACLHVCQLSEGQTGKCGIRRVENGQLKLLVYALAAACHLDPIEKKPFYHFLPGSRTLSMGTVGCNFSCQFCQNAEISQAPKGPNPQIVGSELSPEEIVDRALSSGAASISYTYNEPAVFFEYAFDTMVLAHKAGLKNLFVTSGYETIQALKKSEGLLDGLNIDLKAFSEDFYRDICGASLKPVLHTIETAVRLRFWVEITTLIIPTLNDSDEELKMMAEFIASIDPTIPWHVSGFFPRYHMTHLSPTPPETLHRAWAIGQAAGLQSVYVGNFGDPSHSTTRCPGCQGVAIERSGHLGDQVINHLRSGRCPTCGTTIAGVFV